MSPRDYEENNKADKKKENHKDMQKISRWSRKMEEKKTRRLV